MQAPSFNDACMCGWVPKTSMIDHYDSFDQEQHCLSTAFTIVGNAVHYADITTSVCHNCVNNTMLLAMCRTGLYYYSARLSPQAYKGVAGFMTAHCNITGLLTALPFIVMQLANLLANIRFAVTYDNFLGGGGRSCIAVSAKVWTSGVNKLICIAVYLYTLDQPVMLSFPSSWYI